MHTDEDNGDEVPDADHQIRPEPLGDEGREAADQGGCGEQQPDQHRAELGFKCPETRL